MRNLLEIEVQALRDNSDLQTGLQVNAIEVFHSEIYSTGLSKFEKSVKMAKTVQKSVNYFKARGKDTLEEMGIYWTMDDYAQKMFGWKRSYLYKMLRLSKVHANKINKYKRDCLALRESGEVVPVSVENCLKAVNTSTDGDVVPVPTVPTVLALSYFVNGVKNRLTLKGDGSLKTSLSIEEVNEVITLLNGAINNLTN